MTERRILLHIGTHKTGTSSFQMCLRRNLKPLRAQGFDAYREDDPRPNSRFEKDFNVLRIAHNFLRPDLLTTPRLDGVPTVDNSPRERKRMIQTVARRLANNPHRDVILSAEGFSFMRTQAEAAELARFFGLTGRRPEVFVTFRDQQALRKSWEVQMRRYTEALRSRPPIDDAARITAEWFYDRAAIETFWRALAPLHVLEYEQDRDASGNISGRLFEQMGVDTTDMRLDFRKNTTAGKVLK